MSAGSKLMTVEELSVLRPSWASQGQRVVWTNGCFDLLHAGHVRSLRDAKALGDILIVGINSDSSVRTIKGDLRPVVCEGDRAEVVAALEAVDYVTIFNDTNPVNVLSLLRPDIHCKGADYADGKRPIPEKDVVEGYGGEVRFLPLHEGRSTTDLMHRLSATATGELCPK